MPVTQLNKLNARGGFIGLGLMGAHKAPSLPRHARPESPNMIYRELGRTGERVSATGMGGYHICKQRDPAESIRLLRTAIRSS